jgi:hypothetical protein
MISDIAIYMPLSVTLTVLVLSDVTMGTLKLGTDISEKSLLRHTARKIVAEARPRNFCFRWTGEGVQVSLKC